MTPYTCNLIIDLEGFRPSWILVNAR
jgi:hypothetical protein